MGDPHHLASVETDAQFCKRVLPQVSRTFAMSIEALPPELRQAIGVAYLLCRVVDTIEDDAELDHEDQQRLYDRFDALMINDGRDPGDFERDCAGCALGATPAEEELVVRSGAVFRTFRALPRTQRDAIRPHVLEMSHGMREYSVRGHRMGALRLRDLADLERYCYFVAGTVGNLLSDLFLLRHPDLGQPYLNAVRANAVHFGLGLQLVNIVKDVADDLPRNVCFLPQDMLTDRRLPEAELLDPERRDDGMAVVSAVCDRARTHLERAVEYTQAWPADSASDVRMFCTVPLCFAIATLHEVETGGDTLIPGKVPKITREQVGTIFSGALAASRSNSAFDKLVASVKATPAA